MSSEPAGGPHPDEGHHVVGSSRVGVPEIVDRVGWVLVVVGAIGVTIGAFLPWVYSGAASRNSFGVVRAARRLGVVDSDLLRVVLASWYFVPLFAAVLVLLLVLGRERAAGTMAVLLGVVALTVGLMVRSSTADLGRGPAVASAAGAVVAFGGALVVWTASRRRSGGRT